MHDNRMRRLGELAALFLKLGVIGFGGPAAHIAMMEDEVVGRRGWLTRSHFLDLVGATNLIPGPNSTEMAIHVGFIRAGWAGLAVAGACFILPAVALATALAWAYVRFGTLPAAGPVLFGIKPAVLAIILLALWRLGKAALLRRHTLPLSVLGLAVGAAALAGLNEVLALLAGGLAGMLWLVWLERRAAHGESGGSPAVLLLPGAGLAELGRRLAGAAALLGGLAAGPAGVSLWRLGLFFLKVGAVLYGSGYVLVAFLEGGLVQDYAWLTQQQLLDAIAIGQFTPGPVLSTAAFIGYVLAGLPGAAVSAVAIFLPSFFFVAALNPIVPRLRESRWTAAFLDAVNVSAVALMAAVTVELARAILGDWPAWVILALASAAGLRWKINSAWLVLTGALIGWVLSR
jgi:chromate transporter